MENESADFGETEQSCTAPCTPGLVCLSCKSAARSRFLINQPWELLNECLRNRRLICLAFSRSPWVQQSPAESRKRSGGRFVFYKKLLRLSLETLKLYIFSHFGFNRIWVPVRRWRKKNKQNPGRRTTF